MLVGQDHDTTPYCDITKYFLMFHKSRAIFIKNVFANWRGEEFVCFVDWWIELICRWIELVSRWIDVSDVCSKYVCRL